ncbi:MAG: dihydroorotase [Saprospiraceae bacterium]|nr:dihydroorotase [Saprospiraceae bacterium]MCF8251711.1 dihydroorotase [Saprospiraceae bacterium]MCF8281093.1 dihydroorotase [Bacteroidales bacterium]MCF8311765.1 dihydroorotase [Saprospiraceae bacterium]MCF8441785.1 dihydroorotase [Saprospiraceae bacterium]
MQLLIKNATLVLPDSKHDGTVADISIVEGKIQEVGKGLTLAGATVFDANGACVSPGWLDIGTLVGDPGFEHREDFASVEKAAKAGGYTAIACLPNTAPAIHSKSEVQYVRSRSEASLVDFLPIGAVSHDCGGKDITEMYDMQAAGAVAFSDGKKSVQDSGLMLRALQYVKPFGGAVLNHPHDRTMAPSGQLHEGVMSTSLGMKGIPALAEELMLRRDIYLAEYTGSHLHALNISTAGSVEMVRDAKARGLQVTASVAAMNLVCDDHLLSEFDPNFKVMPPIRELADMEALRAGLADGTIDCITSNHTPLDPETKNLEFPFADFGAIGLETAFGLSWMHLSDSLTVSQLVERLAILPRSVLGLPVAKLGPGIAANLTIFDPSIEWSFSKKDIFSKSKNTPFVGWRLKGKVLGVVNKGRFWLAEG